VTKVFICEYLHLPGKWISIGEEEEEFLELGRSVDSVLSGPHKGSEIINV